ncbi:hypothetical protein ACFXDH_45145 [Streptomyces sp. NPDC059467]|uniref:hypothetical protein n=1 Tax=Streptomyces sp. NPDC059467 TaxID=3346844 RepID=UPI0036B3868A
MVVQQQNPETGKPVSIAFTGPYTTVNGRIWPYAGVTDGWYRFRLVNASNARIFELVLVDEDGSPVPGVMHQIGSDGGLLPRPVPVDFDGALPTLTVAPALGVPHALKAVGEVRPARRLPGPRGEEAPAGQQGPQPGAGGARPGG